MSSRDDLVSPINRWSTVLNRRTGEHEVNVFMKFSLRRVEKILEEIEEDGVSETTIFIPEGCDLHEYLSEKFEKYKDEINGGGG